MTTGEKLQKLRKSNNITQEQLSEILNVSRQSISKWESDLAFPETDKLIALAKIYHCSVDYLLNIDNNQNIQPSEQSAPQKKAYNKKKLPFLISSCFVVFLTFIFFILNWAGAYDYENSVMVLFNFYELVFRVYDVAITPIAVTIFALNFVITGLCISYFFVDRLVINVLIKIGFILEVFLLFLMKDWAIIASVLVIYSGCRVQIGIVITLIVVQFILVFVTKEFSDYKYTTKFGKNLLVFSAISMFVIFIIVGNMPFMYSQDLKGGYVVKNGKSIYTGIGFIYTFFSLLFEALSENYLIVPLTIILLFLSTFVLSLIYYFKSKKGIRISILAVSGFLTFVLLLNSIFLDCFYGLRFQKTFVWITTILMMGFVATQVILMHFDKKKLKEKL